MPTFRGTQPGQQPTAEGNYGAYTGEGSQAVAQESHRIKDGVGRRDFLIRDLMGDFPQFEPVSPQTGVNTYVVDIIMGPAGRKHPMVISRKIAPNILVPTCWAFIHKSLGADQGWWICTAKTYQRPCPACNERTKILAKAGLTDDQVKTAISPYYVGRYAQNLYNVFHHPNPQFIDWNANAVMWWSINGNFMERHLQTKATTDAIMEGTGYINFAWPTAGPQGGRHIKFDVQKKGQYDDYSGHTFYIRQQPVPAVDQNGVAIPGTPLAQARALGDFLYIGQSYQDKLDSGYDGLPEEGDWKAYYDEFRESVEVVVEGQQGGTASQPTGVGYAVGSGPAPAPAPGHPAPGPAPAPGYSAPGPVAGPSPAPFGTPGPQGRFPECQPFGTKFNHFDDCDDCSVRVECQAASPGAAATPQPPAQPPQPAGVPPQQAPPQVVGSSQPSQPPTQAPTAVPGTPPPPGGPIPRRPNK